MKRVSALLIALGLVAGCGSKTTGVNPSTTAIFTAATSAINERPAPISNAEASGSGTVTITVTLTRDSAGTVTDAVANFQSNVTGFPTTTNFTAAHIHTGASDVAGPILVNTGLASGEVPLTNGAGTFTKGNIAMGATVFQNIATNPQGFYFNVHTTANGGGVARGQLVKTQ